MSSAVKRLSTILQSVPKRVWLFRRQWRWRFRVWRKEHLRGVDRVLWPFVVAIVLISVVIISLRGGDLATFLVSAAVLLLTAATLRYIVPQRAELYLEREHEATPDDLIFYVYEESLGGGQQRVPRDFLLQLHVTIVNIGGRKAVLSSVKLTELQDNGGNRLALSELPMPVQGHQLVSRRFWTMQGPAQELQEVPPPFTLEPDDAVTLRFRVRRGIDWSVRWDLAALRTFGQELTKPIEGAKVVATFWRGAERVQREFPVDISVLQQPLYLEALRGVTRDFTVRPNVPSRAIEP